MKSLILRTRDGAVLAYFLDFENALERLHVYGEPGSVEVRTVTEKEWRDVVGRRKRFGVEEGRS